MFFLFIMWPIYAPVLLPPNLETVVENFRNPYPCVHTKFNFDVKEYRSLLTSGRPQYDKKKIASDRKISEMVEIRGLFLVVA